MSLLFVFTFFFYLLGIMYFFSLINLVNKLAMFCKGIRRLQEYYYYYYYYY